MPRQRRRGWLALASLVFWIAAPARAEWVDWIADGAVGFEYTDNLNRSAFNADEQSDFSWRPRLFLGRVYQLTDLTRVSATADVDGYLYSDYDRLNGTRSGVTVAALHKLGIGDAPWIRAQVFGGYLNVRETERSGRLVEPGLEIGKRFSPRFDASVGYLYTNRDGGDGPVVSPAFPTDVFDQIGHTATLAGNFLVTAAALLSVRYLFRNGDFDSACTPANAAKVIAREGSNVKALAFDDVFGGCVYRLEGDTHGADVGLSYGLGDHASVDVGYRFRFGEGRSVSYKTNTAVMSVLFSY